MRKILIAFFGLCTLIASVQAKTMVVVDPGHGGKDPGAIGRKYQVYEKDVALAIGKELHKLLKADPDFNSVMTRSTDVFISLNQRTEIARSNKARIFVSIHADSRETPNMDKGASVFILSNERANDELAKWMEDHERRSDLLDSGPVIANTQDRYATQAILDMQFSATQRLGKDLAEKILAKLGNTTTLYRSKPIYASLAVLKSPDIASVLVETGMLSSGDDEEKLKNPAHQRKIARAIYQGIVAYNNQRYKSRATALNTSGEKSQKSAENTAKTRDNEAKSGKPAANRVNTQNEKKAQNDKKAQSDKSSKNVSGNSADKSAGKKAAEPNKAMEQAKVNKNAAYHVVAENETLYRIALKYGTTPEKLSELNQIKQNKIRVGQKLKLK